MRQEFPDKKVRHGVALLGDPEPHDSTPEEFIEVVGGPVYAVEAKTNADVGQVLRLSCW